MRKPPVIIEGDTLVLAPRYARKSARHADAARMVVRTKQGDVPLTQYLAERPARPTPLSKPVNVSPVLAALVGDGPMPRTEIASRLWVYIREHGLQDGRDVLAKEDAKMRAFIAFDRVSMFELQRVVSQHVSKVEG